MMSSELAALGWDAFFDAQLTDDERISSQPARISAVHRDRVTALLPDGPRDLTLDPGHATHEIAVGDWVLADAVAHRVLRRLDRRTTLQRGTDYHALDRQLIAANVDTLFITTSCNADFNAARLERYLAIAHDAGVHPVILLTKIDKTDDAESYVTAARGLGRDLDVVALNAKSMETAALLAPWCAQGQTVALAGSSGVGKTTLTNALTGQSKATRAIREDDARGRHTTTGRSLHRLPGGGWLIDTPGMRGLGVAEATVGIDATFPEISERAPLCRFRDCQHDGEPGCAVQAAVDAGEIDADRLRRYIKLRREDAQAAETIAAAKSKARKGAVPPRPGTRRRKPR